MAQKTVVLSAVAHTDCDGNAERLELKVCDWTLNGPGKVLLGYTLEKPPDEKLVAYGGRAVLLDLAQLVLSKQEGDLDGLRKVIDAVKPRPDAIEGAKGDRVA